MQRIGRWVWVLVVFAAAGLPRVAAQGIPSLTPTTCSIAKFTAVRQISATATVPFGDKPASYLISVDGSDFTPFFGAMLTFPNGDFHDLTSTFNRMPCSESRGYESQALLDAAVPSGTYTFSLREPGLTTVPLKITDFLDWPSAPVLKNFDEAQSINTSNTFTCLWTPMSDPRTSDTVNFTITASNPGSDTPVIFSAPSSSISLANTDGAVSIPARLLKPGKTYQGALSFTRVVLSQMYPIFEGHVMRKATLTRTVYFPITTVGTSRMAPRLKPSPRGKTGEFTLSISAQPDSSLVLEASSDLVTWHDVTTTNAPSDGVVDLSDPCTTNGTGQTVQFYRVKVQ